MSNGSQEVQRLSSGSFSDKSSFDSGNGDLLSSLLGDAQVDGKKGGGKKGPLQNKPKPDAEKSLSVSLVEQRIDLKEMLESHAERLVASNFAQIQNQQTKQTKEMSQKAIASFFEEEFKDKSTDQAVLTQARQAAGAPQQDSKIKSRSEKSAEDRFLAFLDEETQEHNTKIQTSASSESAAFRQEHATTSSSDSLQENRGAIKQALQNYVAQYAEYQVQKTPEKKRQLEQLELRLKSDMRVPSALLERAQQTVAQVIKTDLKQQIKKSFIEFSMAYSAEGASKRMSAELLNKSKAFSLMESMAKDIGLIDDPKADLQDVKTEAKEEMSQMVSHELDQALIETRMKSSSVKDLVAAFNKFNDLASLARFDSTAYSKTIRQKIDDMGLNFFVSPQKKGTMDTDSGSSGQKKKNPFEIETEHTKLEDQLRNAIMKTYTSSDFKSAIQNRIDILKFKKKLKELGGTDARMVELHKEAISIAEMKLMAMLREAFEERATLTQIKSSSGLLIRKKIKMALSGLKKLDISPTKEELKQLQDQANKSMFTLLKEEFLKVEAFCATNPQHVGLQQKRKEYLGILERLKSESDIQEDIWPKQFAANSLAADSRIIEAA